MIAKAPTGRGQNQVAFASRLGQVARARTGHRQADRDEIKTREIDVLRFHGAALPRAEEAEC